MESCLMKICRKKENIFTIIELLVVIAIICISEICFYRAYSTCNKYFMYFIFACLGKNGEVLVGFCFVRGCLLIGLDGTHYRQVYESWVFEAEFRG